MKFILPTDPSYWAADGPEADDYLHNPDPRKDTKRGTIFTWRGIANLGCMLILILALMSELILGWTREKGGEREKADLMRLGSFSALVRLVLLASLSSLLRSGTLTSLLLL